jgi:hypothetical protein
MKIRILLAAVGGLASVSVGQVEMTWHTVDGGGGPMTGVGLSLEGTTGQHDAGVLSGGGFELSGGFWGFAEQAACYANCDGSTATPALNVLDFACFLNAFASEQAYANCDESTTAPVLNVQDFACFLNKFAAGCS